MPAGIFHKQQRNVGDVTEHQQLLFARANQVAGVARRMARCRDRANAADNFLVAVDLLHVFPTWKRRVDPIAYSLYRLQD